MKQFLPATETHPLYEGIERMVLWGEKCEAVMDRLRVNGVGGGGGGSHLFGGSSGAGGCLSPGIPKADRGGTPPHPCRHRRGGRMLVRAWIHYSQRVHHLRAFSRHRAVETDQRPVGLHHRRPPRGVAGG